MKTIKIISNPYKKEVNFEVMDSNGNWIKLEDDNDASRLREEETEKMFFPFRIKNIIDVIIDDYWIPGGEEVKIVFEGTDDEYREIESVCEDEEVNSKICLSKSSKVLENAREIVDATRKTFESVRPILEDTMGKNEEVEKKLEKIKDALDDIIPICVFGNYSAGKSTFINALIGNEILPCGSEPVTGKVFRISRINDNLSDRIIINFEFQNEKVELQFDETGMHVINGEKSSEIIKAIYKDLSDNEGYSLNDMAYNALKIINAYDKDGQEDMEVGNIIDIKTPFSKEGVLGYSDNKFVIFDTPGSNSRTNQDHSAVLKESMEGFSNGIPVWVTIYENIDSIDNANLCDDIYNIDALDKRFTMIVANKAENSELPEYGFEEEDIKQIKQYDSVKKMYSSGIFFVASIMGLGSKNNGNFTNKHLKKLYLNNKNTFDDEESEFYQCLYKYNIMPEQMKKNALMYSLQENNLIYTNSGLYCIEREMDKFAGNYSSYNKCQMVNSFLNSVIDKANKRIAEKKETKLEYRNQENEKLDNKKADLIAKLNKNANEKIDEYRDLSDIEAKTIAKDNLETEHTQEELEELNEKIMSEIKNKKGLDMTKNSFDEAKKKVLKNFKVDFKNFGKLKDITKDIINDSQEAFIKGTYYFSAKKQSESDASDSVIQKVNDFYKQDLYCIKGNIERKINEFWKTKETDFKESMIGLINISESLTIQERQEISSIISNYLSVDVEEEGDDIFIKAKFLRPLKEILDIKKLINNYNSRLEKDALIISKTKNDRCKVKFIQWLNSLLDVIKQNLTEYNTELAQITRNIEMLTEEINKLERNKQIIKESLDTVEEMMQWHYVEE